MSFGKLTPDDLTEAALRTALFGEPNPLSDQYMGFAAEMPDPLSTLRQNRISEEIIRPLTELLIVDALVGTNRAARLTEFKLGVAIRGTRQLTLSWEPTRRYSGDRLRVRTINGKVEL